MVAVDGSENSKRAARVALETAKRVHGDLVVLNVIPVSPILGFPSIGINPYPAGLQTYYDDAEKEGEKIVDGIVAEAKHAGLSSKGLVERSQASTVESIVGAAAAEKVDLLIVGTRGLGGFKRMLLGSVSSGVISHAHCNVLVVR
jgi:nucleotide-binding universal stress UspA family protein